MRLDFLEGASLDHGPLHRLDARVKLLVAFGYILVVVATPIQWWRARGIEALPLAFLVGYSRLSPRWFLQRWLGFIVLVLFLAAMLALSRPQDHRLGPFELILGLVAKNSLAFLAMLLLTGVTPFPSLLIALRRLGAPPVLVATLHFMYRYIHVLADELGRMVQARRARSFRRSGRLDWGILSGLIGVLFLRAMERGERVHAAMLARGWDGTFRTLDGAERG
jgi:cobalt/nickel transport system permease protein